MTKKLCIALADAIRDHNRISNPDLPKFCHEHLRALAAFCRIQNPRFDRQLWLDYIAGECGPSGGRLRKPRDPWPLVRGGSDA